MSVSKFAWDEDDELTIEPPAPGAPPAGSSTRTEGPTPAGGAYAIAYWRDAKGDPCPQAGASAVEVVEFDDSDQAIARTYADLNPKEPFYANGGAGD